MDRLSSALWTALIVCAIASYIKSGKIPLVVISNPKSGTNLVAKCLKEITQASVQFAKSGNGQIMLDEQELATLPDNNIFITHAQYTQHNKSLLEQAGARVILMLRDPRDQLVSFYHWVEKAPWFDHWRTYCQEQIITKLITGYDSFYWCQEYSGVKAVRPTSVDKVYRTHYMPWSTEPYVYTTSFEKLVGPDGGGSREEQIAEITALAQHAGVTLTHERTEQIAQALFGNTLTFRKGHIHSWPTYFTPEHKQLFKQVAGQLLIDMGYEKDLDW